MLHTITSNWIKPMEDVLRTCKEVAENTGGQYTGVDEESIDFHDTEVHFESWDGQTDDFLKQLSETTPHMIEHSYVCSLLGACGYETWESGTKLTGREYAIWQIGALELFPEWFWERARRIAMEKEWRTEGSDFEDYLLEVFDAKPSAQDIEQHPELMPMLMECYLDAVKN